MPRIYFMKFFRSSTCLLLLFILFSLHAAGQNIFPRSSPEQQGVSSGVLDSLMRWIQDTKQNIHQITIIRNNRTILDADIYPYSSNNIHDLASVTKSITSLLI